ncbi:MAG: hypothetical protein U1E73_03495 [Planctomycetota bacterium]
MRARLAIGTFGIFAAAWLSATRCPAQCETRWQPGVSFAPGCDSWVGAFAWWDPDGPGPQPAGLVMGGGFRTAGSVPAESIALLDPATGQWSALGEGLSGGNPATVSDLATLPSGDLVACGTFDRSGNTALPGIARWDGQTWLPFVTGLVGRVHTFLTLPNGDLVVGGTFSQIGGVSAANVARWDGQQWWPMGSTLDAWVTSLALSPSGAIVAGGGFTGRVAEWNGSAWSFPGGGLASVSHVNAVAALPNGDVIVGGDNLNAWPWSWYASIARWDGTSWSPLPSAAEVNSLALLANGDLVAGGTVFAVGQAGTTATTGIARWDGTSWSEYGAGLEGEGYGRAFAFAELPTGELLVGGGFQKAGGQPAWNIARWDGAQWAALATGTNDYVIAVAARPLGNGEFVAAGGFTQIGGVAANHIARWDGSQWSPLGTGIPQIGPGWSSGAGVLEMLPNGDVIAGGRFDQAGGQLVQNIAMWSNNAWHPLGAGLSATGSTSSTGTVAALLRLPNGDLLAGGDFDSSGAVGSLNGLARWDGASWTTFAAGVTHTGLFAGSVSSIIRLRNGDIVVGGYFDHAGGVAAANIARWDGQQWWPFGTGVTGSGGVGQVVELPDGDLVVCADSVARWNGATWSPLGAGPAWHPSRLLLLPNGDLLGIGHFEYPPSPIMWCVGRWDGQSWQEVDAGLIAMTPTHSSAYCAAALPDGSAIVGGRFTWAGQHPAAFLAHLDTSCPATATPLAAGCPSSGGSNTLTAGLPWLGGTWIAEASGLPANGFVFACTSFATVILPLPLLSPHGQPGCTLRVAPEFLSVLFPHQGTAEVQLPLPATAALAGIAFHHQMVPIELDSAGTITAITATNALTLRVGAF